MKDWLVVLRDRGDLEKLQAEIQVQWDSRYSRVVSVKATDQVADRIRELPFVLSITEPEMGHVMV